MYTCLSRQMIFFIDSVPKERFWRKETFFFFFFFFSLSFNRCSLERKTDSRGVASHPLISKSLGNNRVSFPTETGRKESIRNHSPPCVNWLPYHRTYALPSNNPPLNFLLLFYRDTTLLSSPKEDEIFIDDRHAKRKRGEGKKRGERKEKESSKRRIRVEEGFDWPSLVPSRIEGSRSLTAGRIHST